MAACRRARASGRCAIRCRQAAGRRDRQLCLRARLCGPHAAEGAGGRERVVPIRGEATWLACTDKVCVPEQGELLARSCRSDRRGHGATRASTSGAAPCRGRWRARRASRSSGDRMRIAIPLPASVDVWRALSSSPPTTARSIMPRRSVPPRRRHADRRASSAAAASPDSLPACSRWATAAGWRFSAVPGEVPAGGSIARSALECRRDRAAPSSARLLGGHAAQPDALRLPDPGAEGAASRPRGRRRAHARRDALAYAAGAVVGTGALGAALAGDPRGRQRGGLGVPAAGPAHHRLLLLLLATAITLNLLRLFELPVLGGERAARPAASAPARSPPSSRRPARDRSSARRSARRCCCRAWGSVAGVRRARAGPGAAVPAGRLHPRAPPPACRSPGRGWRRLQRFLAIPMAATAVGCLWLLWRQAGAQALLVRAGRARGRWSCCWPGSAGASAAGGPANGALARGRAGQSSLAAVALCPAAGMPAARAARAPRRGARRRSPRHRAQGKPVFVYFTADWCLTCKANEAAAIDRDATPRRLPRGGGEGARRRLDQRRSRDHPLPRKRAAAPGCRSTSGIEPGGRARGAAADPDARRCSSTRSALAPARSPRPSCPPTQVSSTCVRAERLSASALVDVAVDDDEVGPFARLERADTVLGEPGISRAAGEAGERLLEADPLLRAPAARRLALRCPAG